MTIGLLIAGCSNKTTASSEITDTKTATTTKQETSSYYSGVQATMSLSIANRNIKAGDKFSVDVVVNTQLIVRGGQVGLTFDPTLMQCDDVVEGSYLKDWAIANGIDTMIIPQPGIDNVSGQVSDIGVVLIGMQNLGGPTGTGVLATYHFTALKDGVASPKISDALLASPTPGDPVNDVDVLGDNIQIIN
jgi:hypothetical protein